MKRPLLSPLGLVLPLLALAAALLPSSAGAASWLDGQPAPWNSAGMAVPKAPAVSSPNPNCSDRERSAAGAQETELASAGWKLEQYWPAQHAGNVTVVTALGGYDGMCRPMGFNVFVFSGASFAGTVSPVPMNSREDGVLAPGSNQQSVSVNGSTLQASFERYKPNDPACCPSGGNTPVTYAIQSVDGAPVLQVSRVGSGPTPLPKTGSSTTPASPSAPIDLLVAAGCGLLAAAAWAGWHLRSLPRRQAKHLP